MTKQMYQAQTIASREKATSVVVETPLNTVQMLLRMGETAETTLSKSIDKE